MYTKFLRKAGAAVMSAALALNGAAAGAFALNGIAADTVKVEFESAEITGDVTKESDSSASGGSYLKMTESGTITSSFSIDTAGTYDIVIYAGGIGGSKQQSLTIDGASAGDLSIPASDSFEAVTIQGVKLTAGEHTLAISKSWGWSNFDYFTVSSTVLPEIKATQTAPCDYSATAETRALMDYLAEVYGSHILSGQQEIYMYGHGGNFEQEFDYLEDLTGKLPAVRGFDYLNEANILGYGTEDGTTDRIIDWVNNKNGIATASWHLTVPKNFANYNVGDSVSYDNATYQCTWDDAHTKNTATDFDTANVIVDGTKENEYYLAALEELAGYLTKLQDAGVPLIFRPLHEAEGGGGETGSWFWWGAAGSSVYRQIWQLTYKTLTEDYGLHNIIWEWNSYNFSTSADWYPGDEYVDIIGYDKYSCVKYLAENNWQASYVHDDGSYASTFYSIMNKYNSAKMVALAENDSFSTVSNLTEDQAGWLYFCTWYDGGGQTDFLSDPLFNTKEDTIEMYQSDYCITLDELPANLYNREVVTEDPASTTTRVTTTTASTTTTVTTTDDDPTKNWGTVKPDAATGNYTVVLPEPANNFFLLVELTDDIGYANGGLGVTVEVGGRYYWANIQWEASKSGAVAVDLQKNFLNCSVEPETIEDEDIIAAVKEALADKTSFEGQVWYAQDASGKQASSSGVKIVGAYIQDTETTTTTTTAVETGTAVTYYGDANEDTKINMADAVAVLQNLANSTKYPLTPQGEINADCDGESGLTGSDAITILRVESGEISQSALPLAKA